MIWTFGYQQNSFEVDKYDLRHSHVHPRVCVEPPFSIVDIWNWQNNNFTYHIATKNTHSNFNWAWSTGWCFKVMSEDIYNLMKQAITSMTSKIAEVLPCENHLLAIEAITGITHFLSTHWPCSLRLYFQKEVQTKASNISYLLISTVVALGILPHPPWFTFNPRSKWREVRTESIHHTLAINFTDDHPRLLGHFADAFHGLVTTLVIFTWRSQASNGWVFRMGFFNHPTAWFYKRHRLGLLHFFWWNHCKLETNCWKKRHVATLFDGYGKSFLSTRSPGQYRDKISYVSTKCKGFLCQALFTQDTQHCHHLSIHVRHQAGDGRCQAFRWYHSSHQRCATTGCSSHLNWCQLIS